MEPVAENGFASQRRRLLLQGIPTISAGLLAWTALTASQGRIEDLGLDWLDALFLMAQIALVYAGFAYLAWLGNSLRLGRGGSASELGLCSFSRWWLLFLPLFLISILAGQFLWQALLSLSKIAQTSRDGLILAYLHRPLTLAVMVMTLCIVAPLCEELLFRGLIFRWLAARLPLATALVLSAAIFAAMHLVFALGWDSGVASYFLTGLACAWLFCESGSLWPGIILHMLLNGFFVLALVLK